MYVGVLTMIIGWAVLFHAAAVVLYGLLVGTCFHLFIVLYGSVICRKSSEASMRTTAVE